MSKYGNKKAVSRDGTIFHSQRECKHYEELLLLQAVGDIYGLKTQTLFTLVPCQMESSKRVAERPVTYRCDFDYFDRQGRRHIEDSKGEKTQQYIIRRKLMLWVHQIKVEEV
jgi:hypothetical protein